MRCRPLWSLLTLMLLAASCSSAVDTEEQTPPAAQQLDAQPDDVEEQTPAAAQHLDAEPDDTEEQTPPAAQQLDAQPEQTPPAAQQLDVEPFQHALVGTWESPGCSNLGGCTILTFDADGSFTYNHEADDYDVSHSNRWSAQTVAAGVGRVAFEGAHIELMIIEEQSLRALGQGEFVKVRSGGNANDLSPIEPSPISDDVVGTWFRPIGAAKEGVAQPDRLTLHGSGEFEADYGDETCSGVWALDVGGDIGRNAGEPNVGRLTLHSRELCNNRATYADRAPWDRINSLSLLSSDGSVFFDGLEYRNEPSSDLHFLGASGTPVRVRIAEPVVAGQPAVLLIEIDQPMQYGRLADQIESISAYSFGSEIHAPGETVVGDGSQLNITEPIDVTPGEPIRLELPVVFAEATPSTNVQLLFYLLLDGERAIQTIPGARFNVEVSD